MKKKGLIVLVLAILFTITSINNYIYSIDQGNYQENNGEIQKSPNIKRPKISGTFSETFIHIDDSIPNNWSDTATAYGWCYFKSGFYIIENVTINAGGSGSGIFIKNSINVYFIIRNCNITNTGSSSTDAGIKLENTNNGTLSNNNCSNIGNDGIFLYNDCDNNTISENTVSNNGGYGILLWSDCNDNNITGNTVNDNSKHGIYLWNDSVFNTISGNTVNDNFQCGIYLWYICNDNTISGNTVKNFGTTDQQYGIYLRDDCDNNNISGNIIKDIKSIGIYIRFSNCELNLLYGNSFFGNKLHAYDEGTNNHWNTTDVGNYWDNYTGIDANDDLIGDTPHNIAGTAGAKDYLPIWDDGPGVPVSTSGGGGGGSSKKETEEAIPGYNLFILIGIICIVSIVMLKKRWK